MLINTKIKQAGDFIDGARWFAAAARHIWLLAVQPDSQEPPAYMVDPPAARDLPSSRGRLPLHQQHLNGATGILPPTDKNSGKPKSGLHYATDGVFTHIRCGNPLCNGFQTGACKGKKGSNICPVDSKLRHACNKCLQPHMPTTSSKSPVAPIKDHAGGKRKRMWESTSFDDGQHARAVAQLRGLTRARLLPEHSFAVAAPTCERTLGHLPVSATAGIAVVVTEQLTNFAPLPIGVGSAPSMAPAPVALESGSFGS